MSSDVKRFVWGNNDISNIFYQNISEGIPMAKVVIRLFW